MLLFPIKLKIPHFEPVLGPFCHKSLIWSKYVLLNFQSLHSCNFQQKIRKLQCINLLENSKNAFRTTFLSTKTSGRFFLRITMTQFNPLCCCNFINFKAKFFYKHHFVQFQYAAITAKNLKFKMY